MIATRIEDLAVIGSVFLDEGGNVAGGGEVFDGNSKPVFLGGF